MWIADAEYNRIANFDLQGKLQTYWGVSGDTPGAMDNPHSFAIDDFGNLFVADAWNYRLQKFKPSANADKTRLIAPAFIFKK